MLYIVSQNGMRIADLHTVSVVTPEHDRYEEGVHKIMVNGIEFGRYKKKEETDRIMRDIIDFADDNIHGVFELPKGK